MATGKPIIFTIKICLFTVNHIDYRDLRVHEKFIVNTHKHTHTHIPYDSSSFLYVWISMCVWLMFVNLFCLFLFLISSFLHSILFYCLSIDIDTDINNDRTLRITRNKRRILKLTFQC